MAAIDPNMMQQPGQMGGQFDIPEYEPEKEEYVPKPLEMLHSFIGVANIAKLIEDKKIKKLDANYLDTLGAKVVREYEIDEESTTEWKTKVDKAMKVALQITEEKNTPWPGAANVKYPLITVAAIQFAARAYAEIIKGNDVVKCRIKGDDPDGKKKMIGERVADHMSWQLTEEMEDWEEDTDKLLAVLPVIGFVYRKTYYSPLLQCNVSEMLLPDKGVCHYKTKNLKTCRRFTEILTYFKNDVREFVNSGLWLDVDITALGVETEFPDDDDPVLEFLEQHRWMDLDGDEYEEPYVVTVHRATRKVVRIVARFDEEGILHNNKRVVKITADQYYTKIPFIPAPDGSFYDVGFGILLNGINEAVNTLNNQLLDSGTMANTGGGFVSNGVQLGKKPGGTISFKPNEWKVVSAPSGPLKDAFFPVPVREPSQVLFSLLGMLVEAGKDIGQTQDVMLGGQQAANTPAITTLSQVEQGQQVYGAIFKRIYRAFKQEFKLLFALNVKYGKPRVEFHFRDKGQEVFAEDYKNKAYDIVPVADPKLVSDIQRIARAEALRQSVSGRQGVDEYVITGMMVNAISPEHQNEVLIPKEKLAQMPPPLPVRQMMVLEKEIQLKELDILTKVELAKAKIHETEAKAIFALARAKDIGDSDSMERLQAFLKRLDDERQMKHQMEMAQQQQQAAAAQQQQGGQQQLEQQKQAAMLQAGNAK